MLRRPLRNEGLEALGGQMTHAKWFAGSCWRSVEKLEKPEAFFPKQISQHHISPWAAKVGSVFLGLD